MEGELEEDLRERGEGQDRTTSRGYGLLSGDPETTKVVSVNL